MVCDGDRFKRVQFDPYIESLLDGSFMQVCSVLVCKR